MDASQAARFGEGYRTGRGAVAQLRPEMVPSRSFMIGFLLASSSLDSHKIGNALLCSVSSDVSVKWLMCLYRKRDQS